MKQLNKVLEKVISKKVKRLVELEKEYWESINNQREKFALIDEEILNEFERKFPSQFSSLTYGCVDGFVLIRHIAWNDPQSVKIEIINARLSIFLKNLAIPINETKSINFSAFFKIGIGSTMNFNDLNLNGYQIDTLKISTSSYSTLETQGDWEDALTDLKLALLGLNSHIRFTGKSTKDEEYVNIIQKLKELKTEFEKLLNSAEKEEEVQVFLKNHPIIIQPYSTVFPKQKLGEDFITDFVFASTLDQGIQYTFVEIERVSMPIFIKNSEFSADFRHAEKQTLVWEVWLERNKDYLSRKLQGLETPEFLLIAGRSNSFNDDNRSLLRAWNRRQKNMKFMTYDDILYKLNELIVNLEIEEKNNTQPKASSMAS